MIVSCWATFLFAVACLTMDSRFARALAALICLSKAALVLMSSAVIGTLLVSVRGALELAMRFGFTFGAAFWLPPVGNFMAG